MINLWASDVSRGEAYDLALEGLEPPPLSRAPRLFVLHGNGEAGHQVSNDGGDS